MADAREIAKQLQRDGYAVIPGLLSRQSLAAARAELDALLDAAEWGSGFDGTRTKRAWAPLAVTRCLDQAALAPLVLDAVEQVIGPGTQFGITVAIQVHPGQKAQVLHYDQGIYPLPRDRDVMITALWALDDFTADNGATRIVPGSHLRPAGKPDAAETVPAEMPAGSVLLFCGRLYHGPAPTPPAARGSGSSSTTSSPGCAPARRTPSAPATRTSASSRRASRNSSASTSPPRTSDSSTAGTPATG